MSTPLSDPNAALWASITPPANPTLKTMVRRRAAAFSLDLLAQLLHLRFPETFRSRATARFGILGAALALGTGVGALGYFTLLPPTDAGSTGERARASIAADASSDAVLPASSVQHGASATTGLVRLGQTVDGAALAPTLAATARHDSEQVVTRLTPRDLSAAPSAAVAAKAPVTTKAKRTISSKRKFKTSARRATQFRRARIANE